MRTKPTTKTPPVRQAPAALDVDAILGKARRVLWRMQAEPSTKIDRAAADAVTHGRHGEAGRRFAEKILEAIGTGAGEVVIEAAIATAMQGLKARELPDPRRPAVKIKGVRDV